MNDLLKPHQCPRCFGLFKVGDRFWNDSGTIYPSKSGYCKQLRRNLMTQEVLRLALEALELEEAQTHYPSQSTLKAITAIKEALTHGSLDCCLDTNTFTQNGKSKND